LGREVNDSLSDEELKQIFVTFYRRAAKEARRKGSPFYFVVDGLDWVTGGYGGQSVLDLLPTALPDGIYLLASSNIEQQVDFSYEPMTIPLFSYAETEAYLSDAGLGKDETKRVFDACGGMPGYLAQIRREILSGFSVEEVLTNLPKEFKHLLEREWKRSAIDNMHVMEGLAVLAYAEMPLRLNQIAKIVNVEQEGFEMDLLSLSMVIEDPEDHRIRFVTDAHRRFVAEKLAGQRGQAEAILIKFLEQDVYTESALIRLPILYRKAGRYDLLKHLVSVEYLTRTLQQRHNIDLLRRNIRLVADAAHETQDWQAMLQYSLVGSMLGTLSKRSSAEAEIEALLALGDYQKCLEMVYQAVLPEDRLQLLAKVGSYLKKNEIPIPSEVLSDLEHMVAEIEPTGVLRERAVEIAADLFYVHSRAAMDLIEKVAGVAEGRQMDVILTVLALRLREDEVGSSNILRSRISNQSLRDFVRVNSPVVAELAPDQLLREANEIDDTSARLFLLRSWCNANRDNPAAINIIHGALEIMTSSTDYSPSMRHLRQFAEPLVVCEGEEVKGAVERFDLLKNTAIDKPAEELVRLELLLSSIEAHESLDKATTRFCQTYFDLEAIPDLDTRCYCLVRMLLSLPQVDPKDHKLQEEIEQRLVQEYQELLNGSADHWAITRRLLAALTNHKPEMAVDFASKLNTVDRRDSAYREILRVYIDRNPKNISLDFIESALSKISEIERRDWTLVRVFERFAQRDMFACVPESRRFAQKITAIGDPRNQSYGFAYISQMMASAGNNEIAETFFGKMMDAWSKIDPKWEQVRIGFDLVPVLSEQTPVLASVRGHIE
jgi:hypothetical protein